MRPRHARAFLTESSRIVYTPATMPEASNPALEANPVKIPAPPATRVGIREFRASLADYIETDAPVTVTRHGQAVGLFVPLRRPSASDLERLQAAAAEVRQSMPLSAEQVDTLVAEFDTLRRGGAAAEGRCE